jgi:hypothetical protein
MKCDSVGCRKLRNHLGLCTLQEESVEGDRRRSKPYDRPISNKKNVEVEEDVQDDDSMEVYVDMFNIYDPERGSDGYSLENVYNMLTDSVGLDMGKQSFFQSDFATLLKNKIETFRASNHIQGVGGPRYKAGRTGVPRFHGIKLHTYSCPFGASEISCPSQWARFLQSYRSGGNRSEYRFIRCVVHDGKKKAQFFHKTKCESFMYPLDSNVALHHAKNMDKIKFGSLLAKYFYSATKTTEKDSSTDEDMPSPPGLRKPRGRPPNGTVWNPSLGYVNDEDNQSAINLLSLSGSPDFSPIRSGSPTTMPQLVPSFGMTAPPASPIFPVPFSTPMPFSTSTPLPFSNLASIPASVPSSNPTSTPQAVGQPVLSGGAPAVGVRMAELVQVIREHPQRKSQIQKILERSDLMETAKMDLVQRIVREVNPQHDSGGGGAASVPSSSLASANPQHDSGGGAPVPSSTPGSAHDSGGAGAGPVPFSTPAPVGAIIPVACPTGLEFYETIDAAKYKFVRWELVGSETKAIFLQKQDQKEWPVHTSGAITKSRDRLSGQLGQLYKQWKESASPQHNPVPSSAPAYASSLSIDNLVVGLDPTLKDGIIKWLYDNDIADIQLLKEIGQDGIDDLMNNLPFKNQDGLAAKLMKKRMLSILA